MIGVWCWDGKEFLNLFFVGGQRQKLNKNMWRRIDGIHKWRSREKDLGLSPEILKVIWHLKAKLWGRYPASIIMTVQCDRRNDCKETAGRCSCTNSFCPNRVSRSSQVSFCMYHHDVVLSCFALAIWPILLVTSPLSRLWTCRKTYLLH